MTGKDGEQKCGWSSTWKIAEDSNSDLVKGYSFVGACSKGASILLSMSADAALSSNAVFEVLTHF